MHLSKKKIKSKTKKEILKLFCQVVADIRTPEEAKIFLQDLFGKTELEALAKRLAIAHYLKKGKSYQKIKRTLAVSSGTIASIQKQMTKSGYLGLALKKIQAEEWANNWSKKIGKLIKGK